MKQFYQLMFLAVSVIVITACGGSSSNGEDDGDPIADPSADLLLDESEKIEPTLRSDLIPPVPSLTP